MHRARNAVGSCGGAALASPGRRQSGFSSSTTALVLALVVTACSEDRPTEPELLPNTPSVLGACGRECVLVADVAPLGAALFREDSATVPLPVATVETRGRPGDQVSLVLSADDAVLKAAGDRVRFLVEGEGATRAFALAELKSGVTVYTFQAAGQVRLRYLLERQVARAVTSGSFQVTQRLGRSAQVMWAQRSWIRQPGPQLALQATSTCAITAPTTSGCNNTVTTNPFLSTSFLGATFKSNSGTGASTTITITFARAVKSVTVSIVDSDFSGNQMVASDGQGTVGSAAFSFDNDPGNGAVNETRTVTAPAGRTITRVELIPAAADFVAYSASWESLPQINVDCQPNPVERGQTVTCTASPPAPTSTITVSEWRFESANLSGPIVEASSATTWSGVAATSGTVRVQGTLDGAQVDGEGPLDVAARNWTQDTVAYRLTEVTPSGLNPRPTRVGELGNHQPLAQAYLPPDGFPQISSGPNQGVFYFTKVPAQAVSEIRINRVALALNSDFYFRQPKNAPAGKCTRSDVVPFLPLVEGHEGLTLAPNSHAGVWRRELNLQVPQPTENVVALNDVSLLQSKADAAAQPGIQAAATASLDQVNGGTVPPVPYCTFRFF